ncbi:MAG: RNA methyltransferase [Acidimicrobiales bacterium]|nr:RNA methyltransferase [Acidimicrobiales bacterium]
MRPLSARNPRLAQLSKLVKQPGERDERRALVVEGPLLLGAALDAGANVREVYVDEGAADRTGIAAVLDRLPPSIEPWLLARGALDRIGDVAASQGVLAVVDRPVPAWPSPEASVRRGGPDGGPGFVLVLAGLQMPGNVGTLIRAAVAAGAQAVVCAGGVDPTSPKVVRASAGAWFETDVVTVPSALRVVERLRSERWTAATAVVRGGEPYDEATLVGPIALVLGSEARGPGPEVEAACDVRVTIPMVGPVESLNVAMAGTVLCFELLRRWRAR